jgi:hypothetical protein
MDVWILSKIRVGLTLQIGKGVVDMSLEARAVHCASLSGAISARRREDGEALMVKIGLWQILLNIARLSV